MSFGVTDDGFTLKRFEDIETEIDGDLRSRISKKLKLTEKTWLGNAKKSFCDQLAEAWEVLEAAYYSHDKDNADERAFIALCALTGTIRRQPDHGSVPVTLNLGVNKTYQPGDLIAHVAGDAANRWSNRDVVTSTVAGNYPGIIFESELTGSQASAEAGTLTSIAQGIDGWNSVTNPTAATAGRDLETLEELSIRRDEELQKAGSGPLPAIRAAVAAVVGVVSVHAQQNKTSVAGALPANSFRILVWDGADPAAEDDEIAQAILDNAPTGIRSVGSGSGTATAPDGEEEEIAFDRAAQVPIYVAITVKGATTEEAVRAVIIATANPQIQGVGADVIALRYQSAPFALPGVEDVTEFKISNVPDPFTDANIPIGDSSIAVFFPEFIVVTIEA